MTFRQRAPRRADAAGLVVHPAGAEAPRLDYLRRLYDNVFYWYRLADTKAQLILTLDGLVITLFTAAVLGDPNDLDARVKAFTEATWVTLSAAMAALLCSVAAALMCLRSRLHRSHIQQTLEEHDLDPCAPQSYAPVSWWFGTIATLEPRRMTDILIKADGSFEARALATQIPLLSRNVLAKHRWANRGWLLAGLGLGLMIVSIAVVVIGS